MMAGWNTIMDEVSYDMGIKMNYKNLDDHTPEV